MTVAPTSAAIVPQVASGWAMPGVEQYTGLRGVTVNPYATSVVTQPALEVNIPQYVSTQPTFEVPVMNSAVIVIPEVTAGWNSVAVNS